MDCLWIDSSDLYVTSSYDSSAKYKEKVPNVLDPNQNVDTHAIPNSSLHNLKIYSSKECIKTNSRQIKYMFVA